MPVIFPADLKTRLLDRRPDLAAAAARWPLADTIAAFDAADPYLGYHFVPAVAARTMRDLEQQTDAATAADYLGYVLLELMARFEARFAASKLPSLFRDQFQEAFDNITARINDADSWAPKLQDDIFLKDLGICRLTLIPCVSHIVYPWSGVPRRVVFRQPLAQSLRALWFFGRRARGFKPFLEYHVHLPMRHKVTAEGREQSYAYVAALLKCWPHVKGAMGGSWYFDPALAHISPRLDYLRQVPARHGAIFMRGEFAPNPTTIGSALSKSQTRRDLYEQGKYMPTSYYMVWARRDILKAYG